MSILIKKVTSVRHAEDTFEKEVLVVPFKCPSCGEDITDLAWEHRHDFMYNKLHAYTCPDCKCQIISKVYESSYSNSSIITFVLSIFEEIESKVQAA